MFFEAPPRNMRIWDTRTQGMPEIGCTRNASFPKGNRDTSCFSIESKEHVDVGCSGPFSHSSNFAVERPNKQLLGYKAEEPKWAQG